eukprot:2944502-Rhodomonas_salina.2
MSLAIDEVSTISYSPVRIVFTVVHHAYAFWLAPNLRSRALALDSVGMSAMQTIHLRGQPCAARNTTTAGQSVN